MQRYHLEKIVVSTGVGKLRNTVKFAENILPAITDDFKTIVGQAPSTRGAKKSIAHYSSCGDVHDGSCAGQGDREKRIPQKGSKEIEKGNKKRHPYAGAPRA